METATRPLSQFESITEALSLEIGETINHGQHIPEPCLYGPEHAHQFGYSVPPES